MALPELVRRSADKLLRSYCAERIPRCAGDQIRLTYRFLDDAIVLSEERAPAADPQHWHASPIALFRFSPELNQWTLHYPDHRRRWHLYFNAGPSLDLSRLLHHLDADPLHLFWE